MPGAAVHAAHGVGCSREGVETLLWVSDKGVLATRSAPALWLRGLHCTLFSCRAQGTSVEPPEWFFIPVLGPRWAPSVCRRERTPVAPGGSPRGAEARQVAGSWKDGWVDGQGEAGQAG